MKNKIINATVIAATFALVFPAFAKEDNAVGSKCNNSQAKCYQPGYELESLDGREVKVTEKNFEEDNRVEISAEDLARKERIKAKREGTYQFEADSGNLDKAESRPLTDEELLEAKRNKDQPLVIPEGANIVQDLDV